jgi:hypothetical protein
MELHDHMTRGLARTFIHSEPWLVLARRRPDRHLDVRATLTPRRETPRHKMRR